MISVWVLAVVALLGMCVIVSVCVLFFLAIVNGSRRNRKDGAFEVLPPDERRK